MSVEHETAVIACSEVWGDNRSVSTALSLPGLRGWVFARPYKGAPAGGDVHYVSSCGTGRIARLLLADVAGHGNDAATVGKRLRRLMQRYMNHIDPGQLATQLNHDIGEAVQDTGRFVTAVVVTFFSPDGGLSVCNAGHPPPMLYRHRTRRWSPIDQPDTQDHIVNLPLGILESSGYQGRELTLDAGDVVLLYTDCLIEARLTRNTGSEDRRVMLEVAGLTRVLNHLTRDTDHEPTPRDVVQQLLAQLDAQGYQLDDDLTAVAMQCTGTTRGAGALNRVGGVLRALAMVPNALLGRGPIPWPEFSVANIWGPFWPRFQRKRNV